MRMYFHVHSHGEILRNVTGSLAKALALCRDLTGVLFALLCQQHRGKVIGNRAAEIIALAQITARVFHGLHLLDCLQSLGDDVHTQGIAHFGHGTDDGIAFLANL